jgi:Glycosyl hydrolase catalytic core
MRRALVLAAVAALVASAAIAASAQPASASRYLRVGLFDESQLRSGPTADAVTQLAKLHVQVARLTLYWGGPQGVAKRRPAHPGNPDDPAYDWSTYDTIVQQLDAAGIAPLLGILGTPSWANGGQGLNVAPANASDLRSFAYAAALRYSGTYVSSGGKLPAVRDWLAWNEPNNPVFLRPQYRRIGSHWVIVSARTYAKICNAIYSGIHAAGPASERVACGATAPRGNNDPGSTRPSVSPIAFLQAAKAAGLKTFDAWAHHPYYSNPSQTPTSAVGGRGAVGLGNIDTLISLVTQLYGNKRIWITEYGYETNPPDTFFGVSWTKQARYLKQAFAIARANPRIDLMTWFLLRDDANVNGWQSGLITSAGKKKPSYGAFASLRE